MSVQLDPNDPERIIRLNELRARAEEAKRLIEHPLIRGSLSRMQAELMGLMADASLTDTPLHTKLILAFQQLARFERCLLEQIQEGEVAQSKLIDAERSKVAQLLRAGTRSLTRRPRPT